MKKLKLEDQKRKVINHYGIYVCSEATITGVVQNNRIEFLIDAMYYENGINLTEIERCAECKLERTGDEDAPGLESLFEYDCDSCMTDQSQDTWLIGDWKKDSDGKYEPDKEDGERGYSAIVGEIYTQVVWSKDMQRCKLCSPCYPGQGNLGSKGDFLAYDLPKDIYGFEDKNGG